MVNEIFLEQALITLLTDAGPTYWNLAPQNQEPPFIVLTRISEEPWTTLSGPTGKTQTSVQLDIYATSMSVKCAINRTVRQFLDGFSGYVGASSAEGEVSGDALDIFTVGNIYGLDDIFTLSSEKKIGWISLQTSASFDLEETDPDLYRDMLIFKITHEEPFYNGH